MKKLGSVSGEFFFFFIFFFFMFLFLSFLCFTVRINHPRGIPCFPKERHKFFKKKSLRLAKNRVGRVSGNPYIFLLSLNSHIYFHLNYVLLKNYRKVYQWYLGIKTNYAKCMYLSWYIMYPMCLDLHHHTLVQYSLPWLSLDPLCNKIGFHSLLDF